MNVFEMLRNRFVASTSSAIRRFDRTMVHVGMSAGTASQRFYLQERNVALDSETIYVGDTVWTSVADLADCGPEDKCYEIDYGDSRFGISDARPVITFGDGTNGKIPVANLQIRADYGAAEYTVTDYELCVIFMNAIFPATRDFGVSVSVVSFLPDSLTLDINYSDSNTLDYILIRSRLDYEIMKLDSEDSVYYKTQTLTIDGKQVAKSQVDAIKVMENNYKFLARSVKKHGHSVRFATVDSIFGIEE
jgi:hypothetical protein